MGPTASGKTDLAIELVNRLPVDIISVDSALVYQGLDIGSAKPSAEVLKFAPHRLIDICDPADAYSVGRFCEDVRAEIEAIVSQDRIPLLVGGTMMYFKALFDGLADMPQADSAVREAIELEAADCGWPSMHGQLMRVDPDYASTIHPNHSQRIGRALEVYRVSGQTMTELRSAQGADKALFDDYLPVQMALIPHDRAWLHQRIEERFEIMVSNGFIEEVEGLKARGDLHLDLPSMRAVGYRQVWQYLDGAFDRLQMIEKGIVATRQLAKRQLTWLRKWDDCEFLAVDTQSFSKNLQKALKFLEKKSI